MADIGQTTPITSSQGSLSSSMNRERGSTQGIGSGGGGGSAGIPAAPSVGPTTYFKMVGLDTDCGSPTLRTWRVSGTPDLTGAQYTGFRCGVTPFSSVFIAATWQA